MINKSFLFIVCIKVIVLSFNYKVLLVNKWDVNKKDNDKNDL